MFPIEIFYTIADYIPPSQLFSFFEICCIENDFKKYLKNRHVIFHTLHDFVYISEMFQNCHFQKFTICSLLSKDDVSLLYTHLKNKNITGSHLNILFYWKGTSLIHMSLLCSRFSSSTLFVHTFPKKVYRYNLLVLLNIFQYVPHLTLHLVNGQYIFYGDISTLDHNNISFLHFYKNNVSNFREIQQKLKSNYTRVPPRTTDFRKIMCI